MAAAVQDLDFNSPAFLEDPWPILSQLREQDPVFWSNTHQAWIVTRHADILACFRDKRLSASRIVPFLETIPGGLGNDFPLIRRFENAWIANVDDPTHSRLRKLMLNAFGRPVVESLRPRARATSRELLAAVNGREIDFVAEVARELPARVVTGMFGVPEPMRDQFAAWAGDIQQATGAAVLTRPMVERYHRTLEELSAALMVLIEERRREPRADLLSELVRARDAGDQLSEDELLGACHATIIGGFETTMHMLTLGLILLAGRPDLHARLHAGQKECQQLIDEILRHVGMVKAMLRIAREDFEWHGKTIRRGDLVFGVNMSGSRDERVWKNPDAIDPERNNTLSMAFGAGPHFCLGHLLAKMELAEFFDETFAHHDVQVLGQQRHHINSFAFRGLESLRVRITRKPAAGAPRAS
ncbi:MAG: cytochrome P450 [Steroidobacteraceae bacterium]